MELIKLERLPNQAFSLVINNITYRIRIVDLGNGQMASDVNMNSEDVVTGQRCLHGDFMIPFEGLERNNDNFMWFDDNAGTPHWENFGVTCRLYYVKTTRASKLMPLNRSGGSTPPLGPLLYDGTWKFDGTQIYDGIKR